MTTTNHPGSIERRGQGFRVTLYVGGQRRHFSLATTDKREAIEFAKRKDQELERERVRSRSGQAIGLRCSDLFTRFEADHLPTLKPKTQAVYTRGLTVFRAFFVERQRDPMLAQLSKGLVKEFLLWRRTFERDGKAPLSNRSVQKDRTILSTVCELGVELDWLETNPVNATRGPKVVEREPVLLDDGQYAALLAATTDTPMLHFYTQVLGESGLRCDTEALWLRWEDFDLEAGVLTVVSDRDGHTTKASKMRKVPMTLPLQAATREHFARFRLATYHGERSPWVFHHDIGRCHYTAGARIERMDRGLKAAAKRAGIRREWRQHDLRHRRCTSWLDQGIAPVDVQAAMGHANLATTMRYYHHTGGHTRRMAAVEQEIENRPKLRPRAG